MKSKKPILLILGGLVLALVTGLMCLGLRIVPTINHAVRIAELLQPVLAAENRAMHVSVSARIDGNPLSLESDVFLVTEDGTDYLAVERSGSAVYIADNVLFLKNGKAFKIGDQLQSQTMAYNDLLPQIGALYEVLKIEAAETDDQIAYRIRVTGEQAERLLTAASLRDTLPTGSVRKLDLCLIEKNGKLEKITLSGNGELNDRSVTLQVDIFSFRALSSGDYPIPEEVKRSSATVDPNTLLSLTEDLYRLALALAPFSDLDDLRGSLKIKVDCGLIQLDRTMELSSLKNASEAQIDPQALQGLPEVLGWLCMEGDIRCTGSDSNYIYSLTLDQNDMKELSRMILPELAQYGGNLTEGSVSIVLDAGKIVSMNIAIEGKISALIVQIPVAVHAEFAFD